MKQMHEVAVVKDGNKRVGWLVKTGVANTLSGLCYVTDENFKEMVKNNMVQYFVMDGSNLAIKYTDEEVKNFKSLGVSNLYNNLSDYIRFDMNLQYRYLEKAFKGMTPYVYAISTNSQGNICVVSSYIFSNNVYAVLGELKKVLNSLYPNFIANIYLKTVKVSTNYLIVSFPIEVYEFLKDWNISCKGLAVAVDMLNNEPSRKAQKMYKRSAKGEELTNVIKRIQTV